MPLPHIVPWTNQYIRRAINLQLRIRSISKRHCTPVDANRHAADKVTEAHGEPAPEDGVAREVGLGGMHAHGIEGGEFAAEDDSHDKAVNSDDFTEDDGDEVLGPDAGGADARAEDRGSRDVDSPVRSLFS